MSLASLVERVLGNDIPVRVEAYDGSRAGPPDARSAIVIRSPDALRRVVTAPGELGLARAYVCGDLQLEGSIWDLIALRDRMPHVGLDTRSMLELARVLGWRNLRPMEPPPEEVRLHGRRHSKRRDAAAVTHHYDVSNEFYRLVLGPSMTYSCAVFHEPTDTLEQAQANKYELVSRKLDLQPGMRLLDVGCGWGGMAIHAAREHGARVVGITLSRRQAELAEKRAVEAGVRDDVEIRVQDYRDVDDGPYDAVSSIGMYEHVGAAHLPEYFRRLHGLLRPGGRLLNHGIGRPAHERARLPRRSFTNRYVFPDGELHELGDVVSAIQDAGFEARHAEALREHYAMTLRHWVDNLEAAWDAAVAEVGERRARVWRLYMAGSSKIFEIGNINVYQVLAVVPDGDGASGMPLRPAFG